MYDVPRSLESTPSYIDMMDQCRLHPPARTLRNDGPISMDSGCSRGVMCVSQSQRSPSTAAYMREPKAFGVTTVNSFPPKFDSNHVHPDYVLRLSPQHMDYFPRHLYLVPSHRCPFPIPQFSSLMLRNHHKGCVEHIAFSVVDVFEENCLSL